MPYPRKVAPIDPSKKTADNLPPDVFKSLDGKTLEEIMVEMVEMRKTDIAGALVDAAITADPSALKVLQGIMDRFGGTIEKEIDISDEQFREIIRIAADELL